VNCSGTATGRLTSYTTASLVAPGSPAVYTGSRQYEAECWDYKNITAITTGGYEGSIRNYTGQGYLEFGTSSSASVRDNINVSSSGSYTLSTKYATVGGNVTTVDLYVNGTKVATPTFTATSSTSAWGTNNQTVSLNSGSNTIELRANATGARTIYFDNIVITPSCTPTAITPYVQVNGGSWQQTASVSVSAGNTVVLGPQPTSGGSWSWTGCGTSGTSREQTFSATSSCTAIATYTNSCGAQSTQNFNITVSGGTSSLTIQESTNGFCSVDGAVESNYAGYTGTGFANTNNTTGAGISWSVNIPSAGSYTLKWRYASTSDRPANLKVDGTVVTSNVAFASTGAWATWAETGTTSVNLAAGTRVIRLEATTASGLGNIDNVTITGVSPTAVSCSGLKSTPVNSETFMETENTPEKIPTLISTEYYTIMGQKVNYSVDLQGLYIIRSIMSDGSVKTSKVYLK